MSNTVRNQVNTDLYDVSGSAITASNQPTVNTGAAIMATSNSTTLSNVDPAAREILANRAVAGAQQGVISASVGSVVAITSVAGSSGFCRFTLSTHGRLVGDILVISGSTTNSLNTIHVITAKSANTFTTDIAYEAVVTTTGNYQLVGNKAYIGLENNQINGGFPASILGSTSYATAGRKQGRSINKVSTLYVTQDGTGIRAEKWSFVDGVWSNGYPAVSTNQIYTAGGAATTDGSIGTAANPTSAKYAYITYSLGKSETTTTLSRNLW